MGALSKKLRSVKSTYGGVERKAIAHWCPGCRHAHTIWTLNPSRPEWQWDGNVETPTVSPSIRIFTPAHDGEPERTNCHYFLKSGNIEFCSDSDHAFAGQTVPLPDLPADYDYGDGE